MENQNNHSITNKIILNRSESPLRFLAQSDSSSHWKTGSENRPPIQPLLDPDIFSPAILSSACHSKSRDGDFR